MAEEKGNLKITDNKTDFPLLLEQFNGGVLANLLGVSLSNIGRAVAHTNRAGEVTIKLKLKPGSSTDNSFINLNTIVTVKEPKMERGDIKEDIYQDGIVFVGGKGQLTYDRPKEDVNGQKDLLASGGVSTLKEVRKV
ncbi:conserved hypothetical protein [Vibrio phage 137E35-1]|nr:conserved hypothetical protein [Vibrio phage 137E35-1]CAH9016332.1 conserved hypothetical protein [Vibrio phage 230E39-1]